MVCLVIYWQLPFWRSCHQQTCILNREQVYVCSEENGDRGITTARRPVIERQTLAVRQGNAVQEQGLWSPPGFHQYFRFVRHKSATRMGARRGTLVPFGTKVPLEWGPDAELLFRSE